MEKLNIHYICVCYDDSLTYPGHTYRFDGKCTKIQLANNFVMFKDSYGHGLGIIPSNRIYEIVMEAN